MKPNIHPDYHTITIVMTDGTKYESRSTYGKAGDVLQLDVDPKTHPAWVGGVNLRKTGQMEKFTNKFAFLDKRSGDAAAAPKEEKKAEAAPAAAEAKKEAKAEKAAAPKAAAPKKEAKKDKKDA